MSIKGTKPNKIPAAKKNKEPKSISKREDTSPVVTKSVWEVADFITEYDIYLFKEGKHFSLHHKLGAHIMKQNDAQGTFFAVWAPNAKSVSVIGNFNLWTKGSHKLIRREDESGLWQGFIPGIGKGEAYKYFITSKYDSYSVEKVGI